MRVRWEVDDGYAGKTRPHYVEVDDDELAECETVEERDKVIDQYVQDEFNNTVQFYWTVE